MSKNQGNFPRRTLHGFTLIELLIVVTILGILAAIMVPQFQTFSGDTSATALKTDLMRLRDAIRRYEADHGSFPTAEHFEDQMTHFSDRDGATSTSRTGTHVFGPYLTEMPKLPVGAEVGSTGVTADAETDGAGWLYNAATGEIYANTADTEVDANGRKFNVY